MKREAELKSLFARELKRQVPQAVVQLFGSATSPDRSITAGGRTTHWEFKHGTPGFDSPGGQELTCARLEVQGHCRYVVWQESSRGESERTLIVRPRALMQREGWSLDTEAWCVGYDMRWLVDRVREAHGV